MGLIAIGDVHGCSATLDALLARLAPGRDDHLVFVGDYIDRGPDARGVIDRLIALKEEVPCTFLRGNHEAFILSYLVRGAFELWRVNGGDVTLESYRGEDGRIDIPDDHVAFYRATQLFYDGPDYFFVHAGLVPDLTIRENLDRFGEEVFLWERSHIFARRFAWEKPVVCGHTPQTQPILRERLLVIDTGCVFPRESGYGRLTAVRLPEREVVSVEYVG